MKNHLETESFPADRIEPHPDNRKVKTTGEDWKSFAASIAALGIKQPLLARPHPTKPDFLQIVAGERRWRAARAAGFETVPVIFENLSDADALALMLIENLHREQLDPVEEAREVSLLLEKAGLSAAEISARVHRSEEWVSLRQGLLALPEEALAFVKRREVSLASMQMVLHLPEETRPEALQMILHPTLQEKPLSTRQTSHMLETKIIAPARARANWESRAPRLLSSWQRRLATLADPNLAPPIVQVAQWTAEKLPKDYHAAENDLYQVDQTEAAPDGLSFLHLAQRHGIPIVVFPARVNHRDPERDNSLAVVNHALALVGETALEENTPGEAWLAAAVKTKTTPKPPSLDDREDAAEVEAEAVLESREVKQSADLSTWLDLGEVIKTRKVLRNLPPALALDDPARDPLPVSFQNFGDASIEAAVRVLDWIVDLANKGGGK